MRSFFLYHGENLQEKSKGEMRLVQGAHISMIFQDPMTSLNPIMTVGDQIMESLIIHNQEADNFDDGDVHGNRNISSE
jgi:ABC-type microcin C transport system duplicated ATPase subunit YejF